MRQVAKRGILTAVATGSVLASASGYAYASSDAQGSATNSPGVGSGNNIQAPVDIPVNACGNTVSVVGLLNPAMGNDCANTSASGKGAETRDAGAHGGAAHSPGVASGNNIQAPVSVPINACGDSVNVVGVGNPAFGNHCGNVATPPPPAQDEDCHPGTHNPPPPASTQPPGTTPPSSETGGHGAGRGGLPGADEIGTPAAGVAKPVSYTETPPPAPAVMAPAAVSRPQLAQTGSEGLQLITAAGAALLIGGGVLYRRSRAGV
ncbi:LAXTG-anchored chaplin ChpA [Kitasatospora sp. CMC57]|uniref:LAXTG-anchored chaplin ChpA n=1 Tax=Kitasatospora sp. CMC57 TaxID=3231513 RepID=A0AB33JVU6_9ACTN